MADTYDVRGSDGKLIKLHDNGDGTWSPTVAAILDQQTPGLTNGIVVNGTPFNLKGTLTRPANTDAYTAGDMWDLASSPAGLTIAGFARAIGKGGLITGMALDFGSCPAVKAQASVWIFATAPTWANDNAACAFTNADMLKKIAVVRFGVVEAAVVGKAATNYFLYGEFPQGPIHYVCDAASTSLIFGIRIDNGYIPVSAEVLGLEVRGEWL
jgi:hypothetical protein